MNNSWKHFPNWIVCQQSLEEITSWIDSEQSLPLNIGEASLAKFVSNTVDAPENPSLTVECRQMKPGNLSSTMYSGTEMVDANGRIYYPNMYGYQSINAGNGTAKKESFVSFVPIAPAPSGASCSFPEIKPSDTQTSMDEITHADEYLKSLDDICGTTAYSGKKMSSKERSIMLYKRKLRNRDSASRSRKKKKSVLEDLNTELEMLASSYADKEAKVSSKLYRAREEKQELLVERDSLAKRLDILGTELRRAKEQLKSRERHSFERCVENKQESDSNMTNSEKKYFYPLVMGEITFSVEKI